MNLTDELPYALVAQNLSKQSRASVGVLQTLVDSLFCHLMSNRDSEKINDAGIWRLR